MTGRNVTKEKRHNVILKDSWNALLRFDDVFKLYVDLVIDSIKNIIATDVI